MYLFVLKLLKNMYYSYYLIDIIDINIQYFIKFILKNKQLFGVLF